MLIGIDLGTTYSAVAYLDKQGHPRIVLNREEEPTTPSVVYVDGDTVIVGKNAKEKALSFPEKICNCIKRVMGFQDTAWQQDHTKYTPEAISALIIRRMLEDVLVRQEEAIDGIVITVPTYFDEIRRTATKQSLEGAIEAIKRDKEFAGRVSNIRFISMIDEPKAAALYYCYKTERKKGTIMIYDLGGGTFDATLMELSEGKVTVMAEGEEHEAGGIFFDEKIKKYVVDKMEEEYGIDLNKKQYDIERAKILLQAEECKKQLSKPGVEVVNMTVSVRHKSYDIALTKGRFEELIESYIFRTKDVMEDMLFCKDLHPLDVDEVVLVGGSSRIPYVREVIKDFFRKEPVQVIDPDKAVVYGAALYAGMRYQELGGGQEASRAEAAKVSLKLQDVCAHSIGLLLTKDTDTREKTDYILIEENTPIVAEAEQEFDTAYAGQTYVKIELTEAGNKFTEQNIKLPDSLPKGTKVCIRIRVNSDHLIEVAMKIPAIDFVEEYQVPRIYNLSEEQQQELSGLVASKILE
ncbi:MAG: Hsp70 family protein [Lachnospiraceae bacterium]|nr:Hsp70 family protein [Lachnospiraceae bacterium]